MISRIVLSTCSTSFSVSSMRVPAGARKCSLIRPTSAVGKKSVPTTRGEAAADARAAAGADQHEAALRQAAASARRSRRAALEPRSKPRSKRPKKPLRRAIVMLVRRQQEAREARHQREATGRRRRACSTTVRASGMNRKRAGAEQQHDREEHDADRQRRHGQRLDHLARSRRGSRRSAACRATGCGGCSRSSTVALSTSRPMASARPPSVIRLIVWPVRNRPTMPAKIDSGIEAQTITVLRQLPRNTQDHQRHQDRGDDRLAETFSIAARTNTDWSKSSFRSSPFGAAALISGSASRVASTTASVEASACLRIAR